MLTVNPHRVTPADPITGTQYPQQVTNQAIAAISQDDPIVRLIGVKNLQSYQAETGKIDRQEGCLFAGLLLEIFVYMAQYLCLKDKISLTMTGKIFFHTRERCPELLELIWAKVPKLEDCIAFSITEKGELTPRTPVIGKLKLVRPPYIKHFGYSALDSLMKNRSKSFDVLRSLDINTEISYKRLVHIISDLQHVENIQELVVRWYVGQTFPLEVIQRLKKLTSFILSSFEIKELQKGFFAALPKATKVNLDLVDLVNLTETGKLESAKEFIFNAGRLKTLPTGFFSLLPKATKVHLHLSSTISLPVDLGILENVEEFILEAENVTTLPAGFFLRLPKAKKIHLTLGTFPLNLSEIGALKNVEALTVKVSKAITLPEAFLSTIPPVKKFHLHLPYSTQLPANIGMLKGVQEFILKAHDLTAVLSRFFDAFAQTTKVHFQLQGHIELPENIGRLESAQEVIFEIYRKFRNDTQEIKLPEGFFLAFPQAQKISFMIPNLYNLPAKIDKLHNVKEFIFDTGVQEFTPVFFSALSDVTRVYLHLNSSPAKLPAEISSLKSGQELIFETFSPITLPIGYLPMTKVHKRGSYKENPLLAAIFYPIVGK